MWAREIKATQSCDEIIHALSHQAKELGLLRTYQNREPQSKLSPKLTTKKHNTRSSLLQAAHNFTISDDNKGLQINALTVQTAPLVWDCRATYAVR
ncbi:hypothetical protein ElyMa_004979300 [Elysia marginata]|uniref:Uncharacterized protein n=1 Tax=Elysia marginata TaxID=1093978 RepID=A0AAV4J3K0_9GAST|nr:hypothetical protein ElyMa_004979300 [Elysia marginata]